jgi:hypothetical protein
VCWCARSAVLKTKGSIHQGAESQSVSTNFAGVTSYRSSMRTPGAD